MPVALPRPPLIRMQDLDERDAYQAADVYPSTKAGTMNRPALRRNLTKLYMARYGKVDPGHSEIIYGTVNAIEKEVLTGENKKCIENIQSNWIGVNAWAQKMIAGAVSWSDY